MLDLLNQTGNLIFYSLPEDIKLAKIISDADEKAAFEKKIAYVSGGKSIYVNIPGTEVRCPLLVGHSGTHAQVAIITNFIFLLYQGYGCEMIEPPGGFGADYSLQDFILGFQALAGENFR